MKEYYDIFTNILREELIVALGCTEPIALALASAKCMEILNEEPVGMTVYASGNMIKNVQGVIIPGTKNLRGIELSSILGMLVGDSSKQLEVLHNLNSGLIKTAEDLNKRNFCKVIHKASTPKLYFEIVLQSKNNETRVEVTHVHTNITKIEKNGERILFNPCQEDDFNSSLNDRSVLSIDKIMDYCKNVPTEVIKPIVENQIKNNLRIANEGFDNNYGMNVGKSILDNSGDNLKEKMKAFAASGSDARMSGCDLPVVINSGSGNQGLTISSPLYIYCKEHKISEEDFYRGLAFANLIPIHIKTRIGRLSAFCGAVTAGIGVGCGLTFLSGGTLTQVENTVKNCLANLTGVICDGAKSSCALKIASSVDAAVMGHQLAMKNRVVNAGTGIIYESTEETIRNVANIASDAMTETDDLILKIMTHNS